MYGPNMIPIRAIPKEFKVMIAQLFQQIPKLKTSDQTRQNSEHSFSYFQGLLKTI